MAENIFCTTLFFSIRDAQTEEQDLGKNMSYFTYTNLRGALGQCLQNPLHCAAMGQYQFEFCCFFSSELQKKRENIQKKFKLWLQNSLIALILFHNIPCTSFLLLFSCFLLWLYFGRPCPVPFFVCVGDNKDSYPGDGREEFSPRNPLSSPMSH